MPAPCTTDDFLTLVRKSGVVESEALEEFAMRLAAEPGQPREAPKLAKRMVREGLLTVLQASLLLRGKWRNFLICGKYKLLEHLGTGGMGQVFLCEHARMRRRVAIKFLPPDRAEDEVCVTRFYREAEAVGSLNHPNIVRAHDIDRDGSLHFLVMEYVDGASLYHIVRHGGPLPIVRACHYIRQAAMGLQHAFEAGWVHRDIKPGNLLLDRCGLVKILDLGLARYFHDGVNLTRHHGCRNVIGTADYLAPEQSMNSHAADVRADIYSLGVTFYFLLTGRSPFKDGTIAEKLLYHQVQVPQPVQSYRPEVPADIALVIEKMLAKDPAARYQVPADVIEALDPWTETPIPPPPESEMPQLSRAARRAEPATMTLTVAQRSTHRERRPITPQPAIRSAAPYRLIQAWERLIVVLVICVLAATAWVSWPR
jgi:serine/threonine protein kinase